VNERIQIDEDLRAFLEESGSAVVVGTRDALLAPQITRGWGVRVSPDRRTIELCVGMPSSRRTLDNLADNGQIAVTLVRPSDYRQVQIKGRATEPLSPTAEDRLRVERHQKAFTREVEQVGISPLICAGFWNHDDEDEMVKVRFVLSEAYDQTPGPDAGRPL
jgi:hypothetical protein